MKSESHCGCFLSVCNTHHSLNEIAAWENLLNKGGFTCQRQYEFYWFEERNV